jgi:cysteinyl-tRNA synthetase
VSLRTYDTATRWRREFVPLGPDKASIRDGNQSLDEADAGRAALQDVWGVNPVRWADTGASDLISTADSLVGVALEKRAKARDGKDFAAADATRDQRPGAGVTVEDTPSRPRRTLKGH